MASKKLDLIKRIKREFGVGLTQAYRYINARNEVGVLWNQVLDDDNCGNPSYWEFSVTLKKVYEAFENLFLEVEKGGQQDDDLPDPEHIVISFSPTLESAMAIPEDEEIFQDAPRIFVSPHYGAILTQLFGSSVMDDPRKADMMMPEILFTREYLTIGGVQTSFTDYLRNNALRLCDRKYSPNKPTDFSKLGIRVVSGVPAEFEEFLINSSFYREPPNGESYNASLYIRAVREMTLGRLEVERQIALNHLLKHYSEPLDQLIPSVLEDLRGLAEISRTLSSNFCSPEGPLLAENEGKVGQLYGFIYRSILNNRAYLERKLKQAEAIINHE